WACPFWVCRPAGWPGSWTVRWWLVRGSSRVSVVSLARTRVLVQGSYWVSWTGGLGRTVPAGWVVVGGELAGVAAVSSSVTCSGSLALSVPQLVSTRAARQVMTRRRNGASFCCCTWLQDP